jgi:hypothetical protein
MIINSIRKIRELIEWEEILNEEFNNDLRKFMSVLKDRGFIEIRRLYRIARSLKMIDENLYRKLLMQVIENIKNYQLGPEYNGRLLMGRYSKATRFKFNRRLGEGYLESIDGGFPTAINRNQAFIYGAHPDIDSTSSAIILLVEPSSELGIWDDALDNTIKKRFSYLRHKDFNKDGMLEQYENEDWMIGVGREGVVLYSNALYLNAMEKVFYLYIDKEPEFAEQLQDEITKCYDSIERYFWLEDRYIDSINLRGGAVLRSSIDIVELGYTYIYRGHDRLKIHLERVLDILKGDTDRWRLRDIYPTKPDYENISTTHIGYNGGVVPYYLAFLSRILLQYSLSEYSPLILAEAIGLRKYEWVKDNVRYSTPTSRLENNGEILATIKKLREKLRE